MQTKAAVLWGLGQPWKIEDIELDPPGPREVLVKLAASGLCHSDDHSVTGDAPCYFPVVGGHEGAGVVVEIGSEVTRVQVGDHVILAPIPACGQCRWCASGRSNLCDRGAFALTGYNAEGKFPRHIGDQPIGAYTQIGTFSPYSVLHESQAFPIRKDIPLEVAALIGCGVTTGLGSAIKVGEVKPGDVVVVVGIGGVGINAVQGARIAGAATIIAVDPVERKLVWAREFGATHTVTSIEEATELVQQLTHGVGADKAILAVGVAHGSDIGPLINIVSKGGRVIITSIAPMSEDGMTGSLFRFAMSNKQLVGHVFGEANPRADFPRTIELYKSGVLKLDELITARYRLEDINEGYRAMHDGENLRGVLVYG